VPLQVQQALVSHWQEPLQTSCCEQKPEQFR
jgi:hypothetical protein